jgi:excinuclease UvrABC nuclease subunit
MAISWRKAMPPNFDSVPDKAGVYVISTLQKEDDEYEVKYVGKATNLRERAGQHWSDSEGNENLRKHIKQGFPMKFSYAEVSREQDRDGIEAYLYSAYSPILNDQTPQSKPIVADLPNVRKRKQKDLF